jgi:hopanoid biosynthesis associated RND transporter like protein HpnN
MPHSEDSLVGRWLAWVTRCVLRHPALAVAAGIALAIAAVGLSATRMGFRTSRLDLLNPDSGYNRLWIEYLEEFGDNDDAVIVVEGSGAAAVVPALHELSDEVMRQDGYFRGVLSEIDLSRIRAKGLHFLAAEDLARLDGFLDQVGPIISGDWSSLNLDRLLEGLAAARAMADRGGQAPLGPSHWNGSSPAMPPPGVPLPPGVLPAMDEQVSRLAVSLCAALAREGEYRSPWPTMHMTTTVPELAETGHLLANQGRLGFVLLLLAGSKDQFARDSEAIDELRRIIARVQARHPETRIGLTGLPVLENDEMRTSQSDMNVATALGLAGVVVLFFAGFGGLRHSFLALVVLLLGMAWSLGFATLAVGHLNILSVSFVVVLVGLGIDLGIHVVARYLEVRRKIEDTESAIVETMRGIGPGLITGAVTTSAAFFAVAHSEFVGVAELGLIAGGGILLSLVGALLTLPAMMYLADSNRRGETMPSALELETWSAPFRLPLRRFFPGSVLLATLVLTAVLAAGIPRVRFDHNLLNLQPPDLESVQLEHKLLAETDQSLWFALSVADNREELLARKARFEALGSVERTEEIASLLPVDDPIKHRLIGHIHARLESLPEYPPLIPVAMPRHPAEALGVAVAMLPDDHPDAAAARRDAATVARLSPQVCYRRLADFQQRMAADLLQRLQAIQDSAHPDPPEQSDLPGGLVRRFVGKNQKYLLKVYGRGGIWDTAALERFVLEVKRVDPGTTGNPVQAYYASRQMQETYLHAAVYTLIAVAIIVFLDFRRIRYMLLAMLPLAVGLGQMLGLMGWLDIPFNPANMIALPMVLGIGIDYGVHIVHDFLQQPVRYRLSSSTALSVLLSTLTTIASFAAMMIAHHQGLASLGRLMTIGVTCCLLTSLVMLPATLSWFAGERRDGESEEGDDASHRNSAAGESRPPRRVDRPAAPRRASPDRVVAPRRRRVPSESADPVE